MTRRQTCATPLVALLATLMSGGVLDGRPILSQSLRAEDRPA